MGNCTCVGSVADEKRLPKDVLLLGLDAAGRTTILYLLKFDDVSPLLGPTIGFNVEEIIHKQARVTFWDLSGHHMVRCLWKRYYSDTTAAVIYCVDHTDIDRLTEARDVLHSLVLPAAEKHGYFPILIFASKIDLENGLSIQEVGEAMQLYDYRGPWKVFGTSIVDRFTIRSALDWLCDAWLGFRQFDPSDHGLTPSYWSPETHTRFPEDFRRIILTLLMICARDSTTGLPKYPNAAISCLPDDVLQIIFRQLAVLMYRLSDNKQFQLCV